MTAPAPSPYEQAEIDRFGIFEAAASDVDDGEFSDRWSAAARASILARADALDPK